MGKYIYIGNKDPLDGTSIVIVGGGEVRQGETVSINKEELKKLETRFVFKSEDEVGDDEVNPSHTTELQDSGSRESQNQGDLT